jgi:uncharacterized protein (TIGR02996 family)
MNDLMNREPSLLAAILLNPTDMGNRFVYADWLADRSQQPELASILRDESYTTSRSQSLVTIADDYDWKNVFAEEYNGNCTTEVDAAPPGDPSVSVSEVKLADINKIVYCLDGERDEGEWHGIFEMNDGRWLFATGSCDFTGWD